MVVIVYSDRWGKSIHQIIAYMGPRIKKLYLITNIRVECMFVAYLLKNNWTDFVKISNLLFSDLWGTLNFYHVRFISSAKSELSISVELLPKSRYTDTDLPVNWSTLKSRYTLHAYIALYFISFVFSRPKSI